MGCAPEMRAQCQNISCYIVWLDRKSADVELKTGEQSKIPHPLSFWDSMVFVHSQIVLYCSTEPLLT